jgi:hypothetical protein
MNRRDIAESPSGATGKGSAAEMARAAPIPIRTNRRIANSESLLRQLRERRINPCEDRSLSELG